MFQQFFKRRIGNLIEGDTYGEVEKKFTNVLNIHAITMFLWLNSGKKLWKDQN